MMRPERFAAIDIGSNTFRFLAAERNDTGASLPWRTICYRHHIVRLADRLRDTGQLHDSAISRGVDALREFRSLISQYSVPLTHYRAVATAAVRMAENADDFCERIAQSCGLQIDVISGDEEARLSLLGCCAALDASCSEDMLLIDIGGGSTEFIRARQGRHEQSMSCPLGVVGLTEEYLRSDPPAADYPAMLDACQSHLDTVEASWQGKSAPTHLIGTAGTITTLAATMLDLHPYDADVINNTRMSWTDFVTLRDRLLSLRHRQRQCIRTIETQRADLMIAGLAITEAVWQRWDYDELVVVDAGLLEGVWLNLAYIL